MKERKKTKCCEVRICRLFQRGLRWVRIVKSRSTTRLKVLFLIDGDEVVASYFNLVESATMENVDQNVGLNIR